METEKKVDAVLARMGLDAWRRSAQPATEPLDAMQLAAWLDGGLDEAEAAEVEARLTADPALRDALLGGRDEQLNAATAREIEAARALVKAPLWQGLCRRNAALEQAVAAVLLILSAGVGAFELGESLAGITVIQQSYAVNAMLNYETLLAPGEK